jgi:hypothetical protein
VADVRNETKIARVDLHTKAIIAAALIQGKAVNLELSTRNEKHLANALAELNGLTHRIVQALSGEPPK